MGVPNACEMVGMGLQQYVDANPTDGDWVMLKVDVTNAFNTVAREAVLSGAEKHFPAAFNWLRFCYAQQCPLYCQGQTILSKTGVHQGDPMGPVAFSLAVHDANCGGRPLDWKVFYLDDGILVGNVVDVFHALDCLVASYKALGLECNLRKCTLWGPGIQRAAQSVPLYPIEVALDHPGRAIPVIPFVMGSGLEVLGVPVDYPGTQDATNKVWGEAVEGLRKACVKLQEFPHGQARYLLLRYCLDGCKVNHLLRSTYLIATWSYGAPWSLWSARPYQTCNGSRPPCPFGRTEAE